MARLSGRQVVTLQELVKAGVSNVEAARLLGVTEGAVRYHLRRQAAGATDGRAQRAMLAESFRPAIDAYLEAVGEKAPSNVTALYDWLVAEHDYPGSLRSLQRYCRAVPRRHHVGPAAAWRPRPGPRPRRTGRVAARVLVGGPSAATCSASADLSHCRRTLAYGRPARTSSPGTTCHNEAFVRLGGMPATVRVDNARPP